MTCDTARTLLLFYRPGANPDLAAEDVAALEGHLANCPACSTLVARQAEADAVIARAVRRVAVPGGLKARLHARAADVASRQWRQAWTTRTATAAFVITFGVLSWGGYVWATRPVLKTYELADRAQMLIEQPGPTARDWLAGLGVSDPLPEDFDFAGLSGYGYAELQGQRVPVLEFRRNGGFARVHLLRPGQFNLRDATATQNSFVTVRVYRDSPSVGWTVLVVHTGNDLQPFLRRPGSAA